MRRGLVLLAMLLVPSAATSAADIVVYRCSDGTGAVRLQDTPCRGGEQEQRRVLRTPDVPPAAPPLPSPLTDNTPAPAAPSGGIAPRRPVRDPAPLFVCLRHDGSEYESASGIPERRWVPLWALDADPRTQGRALDPASIGRTSPLRRTARDGVPMISISGAALGTWVEGRCTALSPEQICSRRRAALAGYGRRIFNAGQSEADRLRAEEASLRRQMREECAG